MAMIDYGVIAKKNGRIITTGLFTPMKDTLGFKDEKIDGNYFVFLGDKDFYIGIYKTSLFIFTNKNNLTDVVLETDMNNHIPSLTKNKYVYKYKDITELIIKRFDDNNRYLLKFWYKDDLYKAIYGYGVDADINSWYRLKDKDRVKLEKWLNS